MLKRLLFLLALAFFMTGCVKLSFQSLEDVPPKSRPVYDVTHAYMSCVGENYFALLRKSPPPIGEGQESVLTKIGQESSSKCGAELGQFKEFLKVKKINADIVEKQSQLLAEVTVKNLVDITLNTVEEINKQ